MQGGWPHLLGREVVEGTPGPGAGNLRASNGYAIFVEPAAPGGARPTKESDSATEYSPDRATWLPLPSGIGPVTGQMGDSATALVFDQLTTDVDDRTLDLWGYADDADSDKPLKFILGLSTVCAVQKDIRGIPVA